MKIRTEKYKKGCKLTPKTQQLLTQVIKKEVITRVLRNALIRTFHSKRNTIMLGDLNASNVENIKKKLSETKFKQEIKLLLIEDKANPKFSKNVHRTMLLQTEKAIQILIDNIYDKEPEIQEQILSKGVIIQEVPTFKTYNFKLKNCISSIQKESQPNYIISKEAKIYLEQKMSKFMSLIAYQAGCQNAKTISEKDIELSFRIWLPDKYANYCIDKAKKALASFKESKKDNTGRTKKANLLISVSKSENFLRSANLNKNISVFAPVYFAAGNQGFLNQLFNEITGEMKKKRKKTIQPKFINMGICRNSELESFFL